MSFPCCCCCCCCCCCSSCSCCCSSCCCSCSCCCRNSFLRSKLRIIFPGENSELNHLNILSSRGGRIPTPLASCWNVAKPPAAEIMNSYNHFQSYRRAFSPNPPPPRSNPARSDLTPGISYHSCFCTTAPQYLNDPACPVRVPSFAQQGKSEENSTKTDETSAKPEEYFAESTFAKVPSLPQRESDDKNTANYAVGVSPPQGNSEEASAKYPVRAPLPQRKSGEIHAEPTNDATTSAAAATTATGTEESEKRVMVALAVGVLSSKPVCRLYHEECRYLAELAVEAFHGARGLGDDGRVSACTSGIQSTTWT